jgi:hypothetical protein
VREDVIALYICHAVELTLFDRLIAINGIGPKLALAVLSGIGPAISSRRSGPRTSRASRRSRVSARPPNRWSELKDRLPAGLQVAGQESVSVKQAEDQLRDDLLSALLNLTQRPLAEKAIDAVCGDRIKRVRGVVARCAQGTDESEREPHRQLIVETKTRMRRVSGRGLGRLHRSDRVRRPARLDEAAKQRGRRSTMCYTVHPGSARRRSRA